MRRHIQVAAVLLLVASGSAGCGHEDRPEARCHPRISTAALPSWADGGFSEPDGWAHTTGREGRILGVLFGSPYTVPPSPHRRNKVLWVAHTAPASRLTIHATRAGTSQTVVRHVPLGPSIVNLPAAGCWRMDLTWGSTAHRQHDRVDLLYRARG